MKAAVQDVYLTKAEFERDLEICLTIITEPSQRHPYYVCEYTSASFAKRIVHIYVNN